MKPQNKSIEELLNETKTYWICPITGTKIDAQDSAAIENHKKKIIEEQKNKQELKLKDKQIKVLRKDFKTINNLDELNNWLKKLYVIKAPKIKEKDIPFFTIPDFSTSTIVKDLNSGWITTCFLKINNQDVNFKKVFNGHNMTKELNAEKDLFVIFNSNENPFLQKVYKYQVDLLKSANKKVGVAEKAILQKNTEYVDLVKEIKHLNKEIHDLREKHSAVEKNMKEIRKNVLGKKDFEMFLIAEQAKANNKKMKL